MAEWCKRMCHVPVSQPDWGKGMRLDFPWVTRYFTGEKGEPGRCCSWPHPWAMLAPWNLASFWRVWRAEWREGSSKVISNLKTTSRLPCFEESGLNSCVQISNPKDMGFHSLALHHKKVERERQAPCNPSRVHCILGLATHLRFKILYVFPIYCWH